MGTVVKAGLTSQTGVSLSEQPKVFHKKTLLKVI